MVQAIGSVTPVSSVPAQSAVTLQARLERYEKELSECVNCASSRTPEGKARIEEISARVAETRASIDRLAQTRAAGAARIAAPPAPADPVGQTKSPLQTTGLHIDVQA